MKVERCIECDEPTGKAGPGDGSIYLDDGSGPYCEDCYSIMEIPATRPAPTGGGEEKK